MPHTIEETGINLLIEHLRKNGHGVKRLRGTFDLEVDGLCAEVDAIRKTSRAELGFSESAETR